MAAILTRFSRLAALASIGTLCLSAAADTAKFTVHKAMDTGDAHHVAISYLIPKGWKATDNIAWNLQQRSGPLTIRTTATSPDGKCTVQWINSAAFPFGYLGNQGVKGTPPPEHPSDSLVEVFKAHHPGIEVEVVDRQETPGTSIFKESPVQTRPPRAMTCSVKMRYVENGVTMLTKSGFDFDSYQVGPKPEFSQGLWALHNITSVTGPEATFPNTMKLGVEILSSRHWDPQFFEQFQEITLMLLRQIQREGQAYLDAQFAALRQHFHDLSASNMQAFKDQMAAKDKSTRSFCDYVLDQSRYTDGHTEFILPSGYKRAATNGSDYILTNDASVTTSGDWHELQKVD